MKKKIIYEMYWLRCIACLSVLAIHAISSGLNQFSNTDLNKTNELLQTIQMGLMFGTPVFVFLSEFLLANSYEDKLPKGFLIKRVKFILVPYISMGIIYAIVFTKDRNLKSIINQSYHNIFLGEFVAYFIIIIFQFYVLHMFLSKKLSKSNPKTTMIFALLINVLFLGFFNFTHSPDNTFLRYIWGRGHWLFFMSWFFYFVMGYYFGRNYNKVLHYLERYRAIIFILPFITLATLLALHFSGILSVVSSKRIDVVFYTASIILLIIYTTSKIKRIPKFVLFISKYSFSIYLTHLLFVNTVSTISSSIVLHVVVVFLCGLIFSIVTTYVLNLFPFGKFIVGRLGKVNDKRSLKLDKDEELKVV